MGGGDTWAQAARGWLEDKVYLMLRFKSCIIECVPGTEFWFNVREPINAISISTD